jgi:hypothetical protein
MKSTNRAHHIALRTALACVLGVCCASVLPAVAAAATGLSGQVTDAETHTPIAGANVCVYSESEALIECKNGATNASGEYTIEQPEGHYRVGFKATGFANLYYDGVSSLFESTLVSVTTGTVTPNIDAELEETGIGAVMGRATNASNGQGAGGVEVCAEGPGSHCVETNANGEYTISGLAAGSYSIYFFAATTCEEEQGEKVRCQPKSNYIGQSVLTKVKANATETVNVALQAGGQISGTVTNASITHPVIGKLRVCATKVTGTSNEGEEYGPGGCAYTNASGQYAISGLTSGSYKLEFNGYICSIPKKGEEECPEVYVTQFSHGKQTHKQADTVSVTIGSNTGGIDESLREAFPTTPASTAPPALTGKPVTGDALSCSQGSWSHEPTYLVYQWLRDGNVISGQTGITYTVQAADQGHSIACTVWAGNGAGVANATSKAVNVAKPLVVSIGAASVKNNVALLKLRCTGGGACSGTLQLAVRVRRGKRHASVVIGRARFSIAAGKSATVRVRLMSSGRLLLRKAGRRGLKVNLTGAGVQAHSLALTTAKAGGHKRK